MAIVASYNITNTSGQLANISIDQVSLAQNETVGIIFRSAAVDEAVSSGLVTIVNTLSPEDTVTNLTEYINSLNGLVPLVSEVAAGTQYIPPEPEPE